MHRYSESQVSDKYPTENLAKDAILRGMYSRLHHRDQNLNMPITGGTGVGKSGCAMSEAIMLDVDRGGYTRWYHYDRNGNVQLPKVVFTASEFLGLIKESRKNSNIMAKGSVIVWDEAGVDQDATSFMSAKARFLKHVMQTYRYLNLGLFFTVPDLESVLISTRRLIHAKQHILDSDPPAPYRREDYRVSKFQWLKRFANSPQAYNYNQICYEEDANNHLVKLKKWLIPAPPKEVYLAYKEKKDTQLEQWYDVIHKDLDFMYGEMGGKIKKADYHETMYNILCKADEFTDEKGKFKPFLMELEFKGLSEREKTKIAQTLNHYAKIGNLEELKSKLEEKLESTTSTPLGKTIYDKINELDL